jgi:integrase
VKSTVTFGSQIALEGPISPEFGHVEQPLITVADLMQILSKNPPRQWGTIQSAANAWSRYLQKPLTEIPVTDLFDQETRKGFRPFLAKGKSPHAENTIRTYVDNIRFLAKRTKEITRAQETAPSPAWLDVLARAKANGCFDVALHFQPLMEPQQVTVKDTDDLLKRFVDDGAYYRAALDKTIRFWRVLRDAGLNGQSPSFLEEKPRYGVPFKKLPMDFKESLIALLAWLVADWAMDRPDKKHLRLVTAKGIQATVCMLFGFALVKFPTLTIMTVPALLVKSIIQAYVEYARNERHVDGFYLRKRLEALCSAIRWHKKIPKEDLAWFKELMETLPSKKDDDKIKERKRRTRVDHKDVRKIPAIIRAARNKSIRVGTIHYALSVRNELIIMWLLFLPWRQRNIREMKLGVNLFYGPLEDVYEIPAWVIAERKRNPEAEFWQIRFGKKETKMKHGVVAVLPRPLLGILEDYLSVRHLLVEANKNGIDLGILLLNEKGRAITSNGMTDLVQTLTFRHLVAAKAINPHRFRDLFAYAWLKDNPKDFLTLSKILWHKSVQVTIDIYGAEFDVASGVFATEVWSETWDK